MSNAAAHQNPLMRWCPEISEERPTRGSSWKKKPQGRSIRDIAIL